jgi:hypothetical protein
MRAFTLPSEIADKREELVSGVQILSKSCGRKSVSTRRIRLNVAIRYVAQWPCSAPSEP